MNARLRRIHDWERLARAAEFEPGKMAALCPISLRQLERFFAVHFAQTPGEWVRQFRCRLAQQRIRTTKEQNKNNKKQKL